VLASADGRVDGETEKLLGFYLGRCEARLLAETEKEGEKGGGFCWACCCWGFFFFF
jgi:hypothetical protein